MEKLYLIEEVDISENAPPEPKCSTWIITPRPPVSIITRKIKETGWIDTVNNTTRYARGEFNTLEEAISHIPPNFKFLRSRTRISRTGTNIDEQLFTDPRDVWDPKQWFIEETNSQMIKNQIFQGNSIENIIEFIKKENRLDQFIIKQDLKTFLEYQFKK